MTDRAEGKRPRTLAGMMQALGGLFGYLGERGKAFIPRSDDVIISPYGKCGTTWLQQTFHSLRTRGDTDYDDISRVVPWIETSPGLGLDLDAEQKASPRGFKSHLNWDEVPKGGRYIVSFRDPNDAVLSFYKFFEGWFFEPGTVELDDFVLEFYLDRPPGASYWQHLASWWDQRERDDVLLLSYEGMQADPEGTVRRVARFCGIDLDDELLTTTLRHSSLSYMQENSHQFDDLLMRQMSERICRLPPGSDSAKVREGRVGSHKSALSARAREALARRWQDTIGRDYGFTDYASLQQAVESLHSDRTTEL